MSRFFAIVLFSFMVLAQAVVLVKDEVNKVVPGHITSPDIRTTWVANTTEVVQWVLPPAIVYPPTQNLTILLGHEDADGKHLCTERPLATNVSVYVGEALHVPVPCVPFGWNYFVTFKEDLADSSQPFRIIGCSGKNRCP